MKIAEIAPPWFAVPPAGYGGIEWVVALLADGLVDAGHEVTLFASAGSQSKAEIVSVFDPPPGATKIGFVNEETVHAFRAYSEAERFDVVHDHSGMVGLGIGAMWGRRPVVHTLHGPFNDEAKRWYRMVSGRAWFVAISEAQRAFCPDISYAGTVYNGIDLARYPFRENKEDFLLFLGRVNREKGPDLAVDVAHRAGLPLVMAVKMAEDFEKEYWREVVEPRLDGTETIIGEISVDEKADLLGRARAVLFPITWPEPFGLVMAEANACGTPVVAFARGAAPEVIADGETGFLVETMDQMVDAVKRVDEISPEACRARVAEKFSAEAMTAGYLEVFEKVLSGPNTAAPLY